MTILIADDHAMFRDGLRLLLQSAGFSVVAEADDGFAAAELAAVHAPGVVVLDIAMPRCNGIDGAARIRDACPAAQIIMLSAHASSEYIYRAFEAGATGYVLKDEAGSELIAAIRAVQSGDRYLSPKLSGREFDAYALRRALSGGSSPLETLSRREREILQRVCEGWSSAEIADQLELSPKTVETYRSRLMQKLAIDNVPELIKFALRHGLTTP